MISELDMMIAQIGGTELVLDHHQRERGQNFDRYPIQGERDVAEKLGFVFGEVIDDLWIACTPPAGWSLKHVENVHSNILDDKGRPRASYSFRELYDTFASSWFNKRYDIQFDVEPMPPMHKEERWCRMGKERGYDVVVEVMPKDWSPPRRSRSAGYVDWRNEDLGYHSMDYDHRSSPASLEVKYERRKVDVYVEEPKPHRERHHRYVVRDRATNQILHAADWIQNGDYSRDENGKSKAEVHEKMLLAWLDQHYPNHQDKTAYWDD